MGFVGTLKSGIFKFKQFNIDQTSCAMKINTDGVLLGALADANQPKTILDIGTGTGVIALMLAQRFVEAKIDAVEIDRHAAETAGSNFSNSPFAERLNIYPLGFEEFFEQHPAKKYDLIVSNPPFYINSLKSPQRGKEIAKHADEGFFETLVKYASVHLNKNGILYLILPFETAELVVGLAIERNLFVKKSINVLTFGDSKPHRRILVFSMEKTEAYEKNFIIYESDKVYSKGYINALKNFFTIF